MAKRTFSQLTFVDRTRIGKLRAVGCSQAEIARRIGKSPSTISRELRRNAKVTTAFDVHEMKLMELGLITDDEIDTYLRALPLAAQAAIVEWEPLQAQYRADDKRFEANGLRCKPPEVVAWVCAKLHAQWSPPQIAGRAPLEGFGTMSAEYVYQLVLRDKREGGKLYRLLPRFRRRKRRSGARDYKNQIPDRRSIDKRPKIVDQRRRHGDCEADLIVGYRSSGYVCSLKDRVTQFTCLRKLETKHAAPTLAALIDMWRQVGNMRTLTVDNGREFSAHLAFTNETGVNIYFADPYCTTQRGGIENLNGLFRYYYRKGTSFADLSEDRLRRIEFALNTRPRKCLGYLTPFEVHYNTRLNLSSADVALRS